MNTVYYITGGGFKHLFDMTKNGGASRDLLEYKVPYFKGAIEEIVGAEVKNVSEEAAISLALAALKRAIDLGGNKGVGCTCSLATPGERDGRQHEVYIAVATKEFIACFGALLAKDSRENQDMLVSTMIRKAASDYETSSHTFFAHKDSLPFDIENFVQWYWGESWRPLYPRNFEFYKDIVIVPGSFNPMHMIHEYIANKAEQIALAPAFFELSKSVFNKGCLSPAAIITRIARTKRTNFVLTSFPLLTNKATAFTKNRVTFALGSDTWQRFAENVSERERMLDSQFIVFSPRKVGEKMIRFEDCASPEQIEHIKPLVLEMPQEYHEISSSRIRQNGQ